MRALVLIFVAASLFSGCNVEPEPRESDCQAFLECYLDCRSAIGAFEDQSNPSGLDGETPAQAHTMCYGGCGEDIQPPPWLTPDSLYPADLSRLYDRIHTCITDDQSAGDGTA